MTHCDECEVCIDTIDHHCGYFHKCIGGYQKFAFYAALFFGFCFFMDLLILASMTLL